jgi:hypothetical protein
VIPKLSLQEGYRRNCPPYPYDGFVPIPAYFPLSLIFCAIVLTLSSALSLTLLQSVLYTVCTDSSNTLFHLSLAISASPMGTSRALGSFSGSLGS